MNYSGSCHCGSVQFEFESQEIKKGLLCNCSLCKRKVAVMSVDAMAPDALAISLNSSDVLRSYQFGTGVAEHFFCEKCVIYKFHETRRRPGFFRVNLGCVNEVDAFSLDVTVFDGASL